MTTKKTRKLYSPQVTVSDGDVLFTGRLNSPRGKIETIRPATREDADILQGRYDAAVCTGKPMVLD